MSKVDELRELIREMRAGLDGVTPGPWFEGAGWVFVPPVDAEKYPTHALRSILRDVDHSEVQANAAHIARCSPENVAKLLDAAESATPSEGGDGALREAATKAVRACMSAWAAGEPHHRVVDMISAVEELEAALALPAAAGWQTVPREPTPEMSVAGLHMIKSVPVEHFHKHSGGIANSVYRVMLDAAPTSKTGGDPASTGAEERS